MNRELISQACARRLNQIRERVMALDSGRFGEGGFFVTSIREVLRDTPEANSRLQSFSAPSQWSASGTDCLTALRVLALHGANANSAEPYPAPQRFLDQLRSKVVARETLFDLLGDRYVWPLNFSFAAEEPIREFLLMRLMVADRTRIENASAAAVDTDELMLKLNLLALHSCTTNDLRFLDALNYYYELLPATLFPESQNAWLMVSWLALYARALNSWS
jgi:hypothetical protein